MGSLGNEETRSYKEQALRFDTARRGGGYKALKVYKLSIDLAHGKRKPRRRNLLHAENDGRYERMVEELNEQTLDEAIRRIYAHSEKPEKQIKCASPHFYQLILGCVLLLLACMVHVSPTAAGTDDEILQSPASHANWRNWKTYRTKPNIILQELEIAKQIAMLKTYPEGESEKLLKELDKLNLRLLCLHSKTFSTTTLIFPSDFMNG